MSLYPILDAAEFETGWAGKWAGMICKVLRIVSLWCDGKSEVLVRSIEENSYKGSFRENDSISKQKWIGKYILGMLLGDKERSTQMSWTLTKRYVCERV